MKREDIEKDAAELVTKALAEPGVLTEESFPFALTEFAVRQINAVLEEAATRGVATIVRDLRNRRGLGQEWDHIDDDLANEIIDAWGEAIRTLKTK